MTKFMSLVSLLILMITGCTTPKINLGIPITQPAFLFFYTDG